MRNFYPAMRLVGIKVLFFDAGGIPKSQKRVGFFNMKNFKKIDKKKFNELLEKAPENSLLKSILGGAIECSPTVAYANTSFYNNYYNRIVLPYTNFVG